MNRIGICIPTYKRPEMLKKLVMSINECNLNKSFISDVYIVIVDNDAGKSAENTVKDLMEKNGEKIIISYFSFPVKGLSNVRNELLKRGLMLKPDFLVFVDDDEYVTPEWLNELVETITAKDGDLTMGPVNSLTDSNGSRYVSCWLERQDYKNGTRLNFIRTGNLIIRVRSLLKYDIWFDPRFNSTGGEDSYFGIQMINRGASIYWAANAVVYETVTDNRANIRWLAKRYYNGANIYTYILKVEKRYTRLFGKICVSLLYIFLGICALSIIPFPVKRRYWGPLKLSEGFGGIAGFLSLRYNEYK